MNENGFSKHFDHLIENLILVSNPELIELENPFSNLPTRISKIHRFLKDYKSYKSIFKGYEKEIKIILKEIKLNLPA